MTMLRSEYNVELGILKYEETDCLLQTLLIRFPVRDNITFSIIVNSAAVIWQPQCPSMHPSAGISPWNTELKKVAQIYK